MPDDIRFDAKASFIVALFAAFIALNFLSITFEKITLFLGPYDYPLIYLFNLMLITLFISVYFFSFDYVKIGYIKVQWFFKNSNKFGNIFFVLSLLILPLILIIHLISYLVRLLLSTSGENQSIIVAFLSLIFGIISLSISIKSGLAISSKQKEIEVKQIQNVEQESLKQAEELFKSGFYAPALVEMGKALESVLQKKILRQKSINATRFNINQLLEMAIKNELIDKNTADSIIKIRSLRNKAAHLDISFSEKEAKEALDETNKILHRIDPKDQWL